MTDPAESEAPPFLWVWLRAPYSWAKFSERVPGIDRPRMADMWLYAPLCILIMLAARGCLHYALFLPLGRRLRLRERRPKLPGWFTARSALLEGRLRGRRRPTPAHVAQVAAEVGLTEHAVDNWIRVKRNSEKPTQMARFTECSWLLIFYTTFVIYGFALQWDEPYFMDSHHLFIGWPQHHLSRAAFWYYLLELGFYGSSLVTMTADIKRKDYLELTVHHLVTISLIVLSWTFNLTRVGLLTLVIHDAVDPLLAFGKLAKYLGAQRVSDGTFVVFLVVWVLSRVVVLPSRVVYPVCVYSLPMLQVPVCLIYYLFVGLFLLLQLLHCVWTYYIFKIVLHVIRHGQTDGDIRSDSEMSEAEDSAGSLQDGKKKLN